MGKLLDEALKNPTKQNQKMKERVAEIESEADDFEAEAEEFLELLTTYEMDGKTEKPTKEINVRDKIRVTVYMELSGEQQELLGRINAVNRETRKKGKNNIPDIKDAIDATISLCASMVVPEEGRPWHKENTWRQLFQATDLESLMGILTEMLKPYEDHCKKLGNFR